MSLKFISSNSEPAYIALSTDISGSKIDGASNVGRLVFTVDDNKWYIIDSDLTLKNYSLTSNATYLDTNGVSHGYKNVGGTPMMCNFPYLYAISEGLIDNHVGFSKVGYQPVSAAGQRVLWNVASDYVFPTSGSQLEIVSTSSDDNTGGTGALSVRYYYLDNTFAEKSGSVLMSGSTPVLTTETDIYRINYFRVATCGSSGAAVGTIDIRHPSDTPIFDEIAPGYTASRSLIYTVPKGKIIYISNISFSAGYSTTGKQVTFTTKATYDSITKTQTPGMFFLPYSEYVVQDNAISIDLQVPTRFPEGTDLKIVVSGETNAKCTAGIRGWIETV